MKQHPEQDRVFPTAPERSPQQELASDAFYYMGFFIVLCTAWALAFTAWAVFQHFYPATACMLQSLFSAACK